MIRMMMRQNHILDRFTQALLLVNIFGDLTHCRWCGVAGSAASFSRQGNDGSMLHSQYDKGPVERYILF
jgi:hypothetical protein